MGEFVQWPEYTLQGSPTSPALSLGSLETRQKHVRKAMIHVHNSYFCLNDHHELLQHIQRL